MSEWTASPSFQGFLRRVAEVFMSGSRVARIPTLATMRPSRRWGTRLLLWVRPGPPAECRLMRWDCMNGVPCTRGMGVDFMYGRPADEPLWRTRRTWCIKTLVRPEGGFWEPQEWESRLTGDLETWRLQRDLDLQMTSSHDRQKGIVTLPEVGLP